MSYSYVVDAVRTPRGRGKPGKGALSGIHPQELFAQLLVALAGRNGFDPARVDDVIAGCVSQVDEQGANLARNAVLGAGLFEVSAATLNRFCGSGLQAVHRKWREYFARARERARGLVCGVGRSGTPPTASTCLCYFFALSHRVRVA